MPEWWNKTVTIFTPCFDDANRKTVWNKKVYTGCFWGYTKQSSFANQTLWENNTVLARLPQKAEVTLQSLVFFGEVAENIADNANGADLRKKYQSFKVNSIKINDSLPGLLHTYVSGV